jgi:AraC-like DNA-binding protein
MDALSDVLKSVRLEGAIYLNAEFTAPWCVRAEYGLDSVRQRLPSAEHVVFFHFFAEGGCQVPLPGGGALEVHPGDVLMFSGLQDQVMGSDARLAPVEESALEYEDATADVVQLRYGGGGTATRVVCGYIGCNRAICRPLFEGLPTVFRVPMGDGPAAGLLRELLRAGVRESATASPGAESLLAKVSELLFVEALRRYTEGLPAEGRGWLAGVRDKHVGRALALIHGDPGKGWTVEALAREVALSRSAFAERFVALVGETPMRYVQRWRLALASQALRAERTPLARIAERSGYESDAAFIRAFKREFGVPPATWRRGAPG